MVARLPQGPEEAAEPERDQQAVGAPTVGDYRGPHKGEFTSGFYPKLKYYQNVNVGHMRLRFFINGFKMILTKSSVYLVVF